MGSDELRVERRKEMETSVQLMWNKIAVLAGVLYQNYQELAHLDTIEESRVKKARALARIARREAKRVADTKMHAAHLQKDLERFRLLGIKSLKSLKRERAIVSQTVKELQMKKLKEAARVNKEMIMVKHLKLSIGRLLLEKGRRALELTRVRAKENSIKKLAKREEN